MYRRGTWLQIARAPQGLIEIATDVSWRLLEIAINTCNHESVPTRYKDTGISELTETQNYMYMSVSNRSHQDKYM